MKKRVLVKPKQQKDNVAKPQCGSYQGTGCFVNWGAEKENDILL
jgi:hypothetical protein